MASRCPLHRYRQPWFDLVVRAYLTINQVLADYVDTIVSLKASLSITYSLLIMGGYYVTKQVTNQP